MASILPINATDLINGSTESVRVEFKARWDPATTGPQVVKTVCAFANDLQSLNGGYIVIGAQEGEGDERVVGIGAADIDAAQRWIAGRCRGEIKPAYAPVLSPERVAGRDVLVIWVPASADRPHRAPEGQGQSRRWRYWVRVGAATVDAEAGGQLRALLEQTAPVPWDNQTTPAASVSDLRRAIVREFLHDVRSSLRDEPDVAAIYRHMRITSRVNDHEAPRNVGLLFFSDDPEHWFPGARIVVARFAAESAGPVQGEHVFRGPLAAQVRNCLRHLEGMAESHVQKHRERSQVRAWVSYPIPALREALVNAVFHRSYRPDVMEPTKVCLFPDRVEVISYPGPVPGIEPRHLTAEASVPPVAARNPRVGEFLKMLGLAEGWRTGLPAIYRAMAENGSPAPRFEFDSGWFRATLPAHPEYAAISALEDAAYLRTVGSNEDALRRVRGAWRASEGSAALAAELIRLLGERQEIDEARRVFERFRAAAVDAEIPNVANVWKEVLLVHGSGSDSKRN